MAKIRPKLVFVPMATDEIESVKIEADRRNGCRDYSAAYPLYARLAKAGDEEARYTCAELVFYGAGTGENKNAAFLLFSGLPKDRFPHLYFYLGLYCEHGWSVPQNHRKAFGYFTAGAEAGDVLCLTQLGTMYGKGNYVEKNEVTAFDYYRRASEGGDVLGTSNMAWCYANGKGVERDTKKARELYEYAASRREVHAMDELEHFKEYYRETDEHVNRD